MCVVKMAFIANEVIGKCSLCSLLLIKMINKTFIVINHLLMHAFSKKHESALGTCFVRASQLAGALALANG